MHGTIERWIAAACLMCPGVVVAQVNTALGARPTVEIVPAPGSRARLIRFHNGTDHPVRIDSITLLRCTNVQRPCLKPFDPKITLNPGQQRDVRIEPLDPRTPPTFEPRVYFAVGMASSQAQIDSVRRGLKPAQELRDSLDRAILGRSTADASLIDTIVVVPARIELRVGERYAISGFQISGRRTSGAMAPGFSRSYMLQSTGAVTMGEGGELVAQSPGRGTLYISLKPSERRGEPPPRPFTMVEIVIVP